MLTPVEKLLKDKENGLAKEIAGQVIAETGGPGGKEMMQGASASITFLAVATILCLIGATFPHLIFYQVFGILSLSWLLLFSIACIVYYKRFKQKVHKAAAAVAIAMILTGCSGISSLLAGDMPPPIEVLQNHKEYKTYQTKGVGVFGFGLGKVTVKQAMAEGNIEKAYATQEMNSFGWVAAARVKVYGE